LEGLADEATHPQLMPTLPHSKHQCAAGLPKPQPGEAKHRRVAMTWRECLQYRQQSAVKSLQCNWMITIMSTNICTIAYSWSIVISQAKYDYNICIKN
jgi:hypothetical protein